MQVSGALLSPHMQYEKSKLPQLYNRGRIFKGCSLHVFFLNFLTQNPVKKSIDDRPNDVRLHLHPVTPSGLKRFRIPQQSQIVWR